MAMTPAATQVRSGGGDQAGSGGLRPEPVAEFGGGATAWLSLGGLEVPVPKIVAADPDPLVEREVGRDLGFVRAVGQLAELGQAWRQLIGCETCRNPTVAEPDHATESRVHPPADENRRLGRAR